MRLITTTPDLIAACSELSAADFVAVDTEFLREQTFWPELCLIQAATPGCEVLIDPLVPELDLAPFWALMADPGVVKVFHAARQDIEIVYAEANLIPAPIFDTQVAAMVCGFGESVSYVNLVKKVTGDAIDKSSRFTDWSRRPLSDRQLAYALGDVTHLRDVYLHLKAELEKTGRASWLDEEMGTLTDTKTYENNPAEAWRRLKLRVKNRKALAVLIELAEWRDRIAQTQDVPRNRILRDEVLYDIANQAPTSPEQLGRLRSLSDGFARSARAKEIIEAVKRGLARETSALPPLPNGRPLPPRAVATIELLKVLLKSAAAKHGVAPKLIAGAEDLERIAVDRDPDVAALKGWRRKLFGEDALRLKHGELALSIVDGEVVAVSSRLPN